MTFDSNDYKENRLLAAVGYVLFFLPLLMKPKSRLCRFAANQGLVGLIAYVVVVVVFWLLGLLLGWIPVIRTLVHVLEWLCRLGVVAVMVYYGYKCYTGKAEELPYVGSINLLN